jgi:hypothetical protein
LKETPEADLPHKEEEEASDTDEQKAARQLNDDAVYCLTLTLEKQATRFILKGMTTAWPNGEAHLIVKSLLQKFRPQDAMSKLEFSEAVMKMQLHPGDNPTELFSLLPDIENRFGIHNYSEQQVIAAIMRLIPAELWCIRKCRSARVCSPNGEL